MKKILSVLVIAALAVLTAQALAVADEGSGDAPVKIKNFAFKPGTITVKRGTTVEWTNADAVTHTVSRNGGGFNSRVKSGEDFSLKFSRKGTFPYHCNIHPTMKGKVVVD